jgi:hypothetical protein
MEVNFSMIETYVKKTNKGKQILCVVKGRKELVLKHLEDGIEKLKEARTEIPRSVQAAIEMGVESDDIANEAVYAVSEVFAGDDDYWVFKDNLLGLSAR